MPSLRERLGVSGKPGDVTYDKALFNAIKNVQARADIKPTGLIDGKTIAAINGPKPGQQRSSACSPIWNAGAGCRAISARPM